MEVIQELAGNGNTVVIIEHNLDVIKQADWILDLGPEGGDGGGEIVAAGTPEDVAKVAKSYTGQFLKPLLRGSRPASAPSINASAKTTSARPAKKKTAGKQNAKSPAKAAAAKAGAKTTKKKAVKKTARKRKAA